MSDDPRYPPGAVVEHAIITPECRQNRGTDGALAEAIQRVTDQYWQVVHGWQLSPEQPTLHLVLTMERPAKSDRGSTQP